MLTLEIITPTQTVVTTEGDEITLPTLQGQIGVRAGHIPLVTPLKAGEIILHHGKESQSFVVGGGFAEVLPTGVHVLADLAEHTQGIDESSVQEAIKRAEHIKAAASGSRQLAQATAILEMNLAKLKVVQRRHRHHSKDL
jgi:F-type H+-transporting ATPase subunit epsilon